MLEISSGVKARSYIDGYGNRCERMTIPAGATRIVYGADIDDKAAFGLADPRIRCLGLQRTCSRPIEVVPRVGREECVELFRQFAGKK